MRSSCSLCGFVIPLRVRVAEPEGTPVARQRLGENFTAAKNTHAVREELLNSAFCMSSVSYEVCSERKAGSQVFPELLAFVPLSLIRTVDLAGSLESNRKKRLRGAAFMWYNVQLITKTLGGPFPCRLPFPASTLRAGGGCLTPAQSSRLRSRPGWRSELLCRPYKSPADQRTPEEGPICSSFLLLPRFFSVFFLFLLSRHGGRSMF